MTAHSLLPPAVSVREVGPRDGLQNEDPVSAHAKTALINTLSRTGLRRIQAVSFSRPSVVPQMADAEEVWSQIDKNPLVSYSALVPNFHGAERAVRAGATDVQIVISASNTHNKKNVNRSTDESLAELAQTTALVKQAGGTVDVLIPTAWGCPFEGEVPTSAVLSVIFSVMTEGASSVTLADSTGMATPARVEVLIMKAQALLSGMPLGVHLHNTRGTGLANVYAAMLMGVTIFDTAVGGLGSAPGQLGGNGLVATEDLVAMADDMRVETGINLDAVLDAASFAQLTVGRALPSSVLTAGPRTKLLAADAAAF